MDKATRNYKFQDISACEMCGAPKVKHKYLGQRLNKSQGLSPKKVSGISISVMKCTVCGLIFSDPLPIPEDIQDHYGLPAEDYWKEDYFKYQPEYFRHELEWLEKLLVFKPGMKALDIGAGLGKCMISLQNSGFDTFGFEPSKPFYEKAIEKMGMSPDRLTFNMMETVMYPENVFDFITFGAVLEHLYHPAESIEKAMKWLKPGGIIHVEVPSSDYYISSLLNKYNRLRGTNYVSHLSPMHPPFHLYEFTATSFELLGKRLGYLLADKKVFVGKTIFFPGAIRKLVDSYMEKTDRGMQLTIWLRKI
ncbi:MAG: class I SAM-dependent methyltransferase [Chitinophagaceae bacterium]